MNRWHSLYLLSNQPTQTPEIITTCLTSHGYTLYNPFTMLPGKTYSDTVRLFIAPSDSGWLRILVDTEQLIFMKSVAEDLSTVGLCLSLLLQGTDAEIAVYQERQSAELPTVLVPYLRKNSTISDLQQALNSSISHPSAQKEPFESIRIDSLPDDIQQLAAGVDIGKVQRLFGKLSGSLVADENQMAARQLLGNHPNWNSEGGKKIISFMSCLNILNEWREPDFVTLRDAYQLLIHRKRNPKARLYPGDTDAMQAVPNALDYLPIYAGRDE